MSPKRVNARMQSSNTPHIDSPEFKTAEFRMYSLKVIDCPNRNNHEWTTCPFAHPSEKARRRDPRKFKYTGIACPTIKQSVACTFQDSCPYAHNVFEYWLHPTRYRTQLCNIASSCNRNICFFAHTIDELRVPSAQEQGMGSNIAPSLRPSNAIHPFSGGSRESADMFSASGNPTDLIMEAYANDILRELMTFRQISNEPYSLNGQSLSANDFTEIQRLYAMLQRYQNLVGLSESTPNDKLKFLSALLQSLSRAVSHMAIQNAERERLTKLFYWMHVQMVQTQQPLFSQPDAGRPFTAQDQTDMSHLSMFDSRRVSLSRIPEMGPTFSMSRPSLHRTSQEGVLPLTTSIHPPNVAPDAHLQNFMTRSPGLDPRNPGYQWRWTPSQSSLRMSDESTATWMSTHRTSGTFSQNRSSVDSETQNRRSWTAATNESPTTLAREDSSQAPEFICHEMVLNRVPPPPGSSPPFLSLVFCEASY